jgi:hypothetical protein
MSGASKKLMSAAGAGAGGGFTAIEDVFHTYVYRGNSTNTDVVNGLDLAGEGGMLWHKNRSISHQHYVFDTERGAAPLFPYIQTNDTAAEFGTTGRLVSWNSDGYTIGDQGNFNETGQNNVIWTFRKAPRFFDVVTWTGTGGARTVDHNLGTTVGSLIIKRTDISQNWYVYHRGVNFGATQFPLLVLNTTAAASANKELINSTEPTDTVFSVASDLNTSGGTYVAYLFAHNDGDGEFGPDGDADIIKCGSLNSGTVGNDTTVDLGFEPQWILFKNSSNPAGADGWWMYDTMRGWTGSLGDPNNKNLQAQTSSAEGNITNYINITPTGFVMEGGAFDSNHTYIYIAIRRGPMRAPESGTEVFAPVKRLEVSTDIMPTNTGFATDLVIHKPRITGSNPWFLASRLQGDDIALSSNSTAAEASYAAIIGDGFWKFDSNDGAYIGSGGYYNNSGNTSPNVSYSFLRAPSFFDVVAYSGDGVAGRTVPHNLGVAPEMMIVKNRSGSSSWIVYHFGLNNSVVPEQYYLPLESTSPESQLILFNNTAPTSTDFTVHSSTSVNGSGSNYVAYLFSTLAGISKVGFYAGNGTSQTIDCGFTTGARFVLIRRYNSSGGDWYVWDTAQGIVTGDDPNLSLNTTAAVEPSNDSVDPDSSGFIVNQVAATNINVSASRYIFYAVS